MTLIIKKMFVLSYAGIGTSIGQPMEVPIILRSLAVGFATLEERELPVTFDNDFMLTLDTNLAEQNRACRMVRNYKCQWWTARKPRDLDLASILDKSTLDECLDTHDTQTTHTGASVTSTTLGPSNNDAAREKPDQSCAKCLEYGSIFSNTLIDMVNIITFANMMLTSSETQWNLDMHRASIFHSLHEAAIIKETTGCSSGVHPSSGAHLSSSGPSARVESVRRSAEEELIRLKNLPPTSHKWTWGESLTLSDVLALQRTGTMPRKEFHSGYDMPLKDGKREEDTPTPPMPETLHEQQSEMADDDLVLPDNDVSPHPNVEKMRSRVYDPLGKRRAPQIFPYNSAGNQDKSRKNISRIPATLTMGNLLILDGDDSTGGENLPDGIVSDTGPEYINDEVSIRESIEDMWEIGGSPDTPIEDMWPSGSKSDDGNDSTPIEDIWEPGSQETQVRNTTGIEDEVNSLGRSNIQKTGIEDEWPQDESPTRPIDTSSQISMNSQFMVTPSRITLQRNDFPYDGPWPDLDSPETLIPPDNPSSVPLASGTYRRYGPDDFAYLKDEMFEDKSSESDPEYD